MPEPLPAASESLRIRAVRRRRRQDRTAIALLLVLAVAVSSGGITWGLPSRDADKYLFGQHPAWSGSQLLELTGRRDRDSSRGADVDRDPLLAREHKLILNQTDAQRGEIVRRYRLFTYHPDEMVTLMALAEMRPGQGDFDPKLYQYGGLWVYPIGAMLKTCSVLGILRVTSDLGYYFDDPAQFGRFYVVARLYVVAWAIVGAWAVFALTRRLTRGSVLAACIACFSYIMMPVVVNMSHEAKPHLPGAVLMLLTVLAAVRYVRTVEGFWWLLACVLAGLSVGMVPAAWPVVFALPIATLIVRQEWRARVRICVRGVGLSVAVYLITNPYVLIHLFDNRELLRSNLGNTRAMFHAGLSAGGIWNAIMLLAEGTAPLLAAGGVAGIVTLIVSAALRRDWAIRSSAWLLIGPAGLVLAQFTWFAGGQPGDYGRFAIFVDIVLVIAAVVGGYYLLAWREWRPELLLMVGLAAAIPGSRYYGGFVSDAIKPTTRTNAAQLIEARRLAGARTVGVFAEPAPYVVPPLNLFDWQVVLLPKGYQPQTDPNPPDLIVRATDDLSPPAENWAVRYEWEFVNTAGDPAPMRWAAKPFIILSRKRGL